MEDKIGSLVAEGFSVDLVIRLFEEIDAQILQLHQCSSDDFLGLNAKFKAFYKEARGISTSAGSLFLLFSEGANRKLISSLEDFYEQLACNQMQITDQLNASVQTMESMRIVLRKQYLPLRNIAQNMGTVSLLLANIRLGYSTHLAREGYTQEDLEALRATVDSFVEHMVGMVHRTKQLTESLERSIEHVTYVRSKTLSGLDIVTNALHYGLILFAEKHEEANVRIPEISAKTDSCSKSIAGVITNLQYQDIIRQKMEHIQSAHQKLMDDMRLLETQDGDLADRQRLRLLVQVRDISALQSAQLVATNREYQNAIEVIAQSFRDIARDMEAIAELCRDTLLAGDESGSSTTITSLLQRLKRSGAVLGDLAELIPTFREELQSVSETLGEFSTGLMTGHREYVAVRQRIQHDIQDRLRVGRDDKFESIMGQLSTVLRDLDDFDKGTVTSFEDLSRGMSELERHEQNLAETLPLWSGFKLGADRMHSIGLGLAQTEQESKGLLSEIESMSKKVSLATRDAMADIKYYDFFERVIGRIIEALNGLSTQIREQVGADENADIEDMRKLYTMASEHRIHDSFSEGDQGNVDLFGGEVIDNNSLSEEGDDGLELF